MSKVGRLPQEPPRKPGNKPWINLRCGCGRLNFEPTDWNTSWGSKKHSRYQLNHTCCQLLTAPPKPTGSLALDQAVTHLWREGIDPNLVQLPPSEHRLRTKDSKAALLFGSVGALLPSIGVGNGFVVEALQSIQRAADGGKLPGVFQLVFGRGSAPFLDASKGKFHRFDGSHDPLNALPTGIRELGLVRGSLEVSQHLLTDAFGVTGIPLPGSHALAGHLDQGTLSRYAALRLSDVAASGTTSLLLWLYFEKEQISESSMRRPQMALLAHSTCLAATFLSTALLGIGAAARSSLNYVSIGSMLHSYWQVRKMTAQLMESNQKRFRAMVARMASVDAHKNKQLNISQIDTEVREAVLLLDRI